MALKLKNGENFQKKIIKRYNVERKTGCKGESYPAH